MTDDLAEFAPERIKFWLAGSQRRCDARSCRWTMLESAVEGGAGQSSGARGSGSRFNLVYYKADLERAADQLPLYWQSTAFIFARQHRSKILQQRRLLNRTPDACEFESPVPSQALDDAVYRMARTLGWREGLTSAA